MPASVPSISVTHPSPTVAVVALAGGHDLASAHEVVHAFQQLAADDTSIVADLSQLTFFDTTTIHALLVGKKLVLARARIRSVPAGDMDAPFGRGLCRRGRD